MFKHIIAYYLPFDGALAFRLPWIWENARRYAYRHAIACVALATISFSATSYHFDLAATAAHGLAMVTIFFAAIFTAAALDPRFR